MHQYAVLNLVSQMMIIEITFGCKYQNKNILLIKNCFLSICKYYGRINHKQYPSFYINTEYDKYNLLRYELKLVSVNGKVF